MEVESFKYHTLHLTPNMKTSSPVGILSLIYAYNSGLQDTHSISTLRQRENLLDDSSFVASNAKRFSKLKLVKTYLKNLLQNNS